MHTVPRTQTARDSRLTLDELLDHTAALIEHGGIDAVTFRALAARCQVGPATLYQYVETKDELLGLYVDRLLATIALPADSASWQETVHYVFTSVYEILAAHAELAPILGTRALPGAQAARLLRSVVSALSDAGLTPTQITTAYDVLAAYTTGFVQQSAGRSQRAPGLAELLDATAAQPRTRSHTEAARFDAGLQVLLAGLDSPA